MPLPSTFDRRTAKRLEPQVTEIEVPAAPGYSGVGARLGDTGQWEVPALPSGPNSGISKNGYSGVDAGEVSTLYSRVTGLDGGGTGSVNPLVPQQDAAQIQTLKQIEQLAQQLSKPRPSAKLEDNPYVRDVEQYRDRMSDPNQLYRSGGYTGSAGDRARVGAGLFAGTFAEMMGAGGAGKALIGMADPNAAYERGKDAAGAGLTSSLKLADMAANYEFNKDQNERSSNSSGLSALKAAQWAYEQQYADANTQQTNATRLAAEAEQSRRSADTNKTRLFTNLLTEGGRNSRAEYKARMDRLLEQGRMTRAQWEARLKAAGIEIDEREVGVKEQRLPAQNLRDVSAAGKSREETRLLPIEAQRKQRALELAEAKQDTENTTTYLGAMLDPKTGEQFKSLLAGQPESKGFFGGITPEVPADPAALKLREAAQRGRLEPVSGDAAGGSAGSGGIPQVDAQVKQLVQSGQFTDAIFAIKSSAYPESYKQQVIAQIEGLRKARTQGR